jgi:hypothetical protein
MNPLEGLSDKRLLEHIARLERDIQDIEHRVSLQKTLLERQDRFSASEPLYQRLTSIRDHLRADLQQAQGELELLRRGGYPPSRWSLRSAVAALVGARG